MIATDFTPWFLPSIMSSGTFDSKSETVGDLLGAGRRARIVVPEFQRGYVLTRIAELMQSPTKELARGEANLEHIFPQNPDEDKWGGVANQEVLEPYLWNLGNLTIYGKKINSRSGNKEFEEKRKDYETKSTISMTLEVAAKYTKWDVSSIKDRALYLTKKALEIWNFESPSRV